MLFNGEADKVQGPVFKYEVGGEIAYAGRL